MLKMRDLKSELLESESWDITLKVTIFYSMDKKNKHCKMLKSEFHQEKKSIRKKKVIFFCGGNKLP